MQNVGDIVLAKVVQIRVFGVELQAGEDHLILLGPDASEPGDIPVERLFRIGDLVKVKIERFSESNNAYRVTLAAK